MQRTIGLSALLILLTASTIRASDPQATELVGLMTMAVRGTTEQLQLVQHVESARLSAEPLGQFDKYFAYFLAQGKRVKIANADPGALQVYERAVSALEPEWNRVAADNDLKFVQERMPAFRRFMAERSGKRPELAAEGAHTLATAALMYEIRYGQIAERLEQLVTPPGGGEPLIDRDALTDPWGRPYRYDPTGLHNAGVRPDVWSLGPDPDDPAGVIGNWMARLPAKQR